MPVVGEPESDPVSHRTLCMDPVGGGPGGELDGQLHQPPRLQNTGAARHGETSNLDGVERIDWNCKYEVFWFWFLTCSCPEMKKSNH